MSARTKTKSPAKTRSAPRPTGQATSNDAAKSHRFTWTLLTLGVVVTVLALGTQWALHQPFFRVQHVHLEGEVHESARQVLLATGLDAHPTMLSVSTTNIERDLRVFPWIKSVRVSTHWPNTVDVEIHETVPVAVAFAASGQLRYVSPQGRDLGAAPLDANYPTLTYLSPRSSSWPFARAGIGAATVAAALPPAFAAQVSDITVNDRGDVTLRMSTPVTFVLGAADQLHQKFVAIASVIAHSTLRPGDVVDVSVPDELAVTGPAPS